MASDFIGDVDRRAIISRTISMKNLAYAIEHVLPHLEDPIALRIRSTPGRAKATIRLTAVDAAAISDACGARFCAVGLGPDFEPNAEGRFIDELLGIFNPISPGWRLSG